MVARPSQDGTHRRYYTVDTPESDQSSVGLPEGAGFQHSWATQCLSGSRSRPGLQRSEHGTGPHQLEDSVRLIHVVVEHFVLPNNLIQGHRSNRMTVMLSSSPTDGEDRMRVADSE